MCTVRNYVAVNKRIILSRSDARLWTAHPTWIRRATIISLICVRSSPTQPPLQTASCPIQWSLLCWSNLPASFFLCSLLLFLLIALFTFNISFIIHSSLVTILLIRFWWVFNKFVLFCKLQEEMLHIWKANGLKFNSETGYSACCFV